MKFFYRLLFLPILIFAFTGCEKDDDVVNDDDETPYALSHSKDLTTDDGKVTQLQKHKVGKGVPIVILGDGFLDKDIRKGDFRDATTSAIDAIFSVHPLKSLRDYFDVYEVTAVSYNNTNLMALVEDSTNYNTAFNVMEIEEMGGGALTTKLDLGDLEKIIKYAEKAVNRNRIDDMTIIMLVNDFSSSRAFATYYTANSEDRDIPTGCGIAYVPLEDIMKHSPLQDIMTPNDEGISRTSFGRTLLHEFGHAFAKLADEYVDDGQKWEDLASGMDYLMWLQKTGYDRNVSIFGDVKDTYWADFAADSRYDFEKLGCYEGGCCQDVGVYRATENSIMRGSMFNYHNYNVIGRAMIYKRCMNIAFGDSWKFIYEDFVKFDLEKAKAEHEEIEKLYQKYIPDYHSTSKRFCAPPRFVDSVSRLRAIKTTK